MLQSEHSSALAMLARGPQSSVASADRGSNTFPTPQLVKCFDEAMGLIRAGVEGHTSEAAYLHRSFGSSESHFMAILYLLLQRNLAARSCPTWPRWWRNTTAGCKGRNSY